MSWPQVGSLLWYAIVISAAAVVAIAWQWVKGE
jgi:hypothetical protein